MTLRPSYNKIWASGGVLKKPTDTEYGSGWASFEVIDSEVSNYLYNNTQSFSLECAVGGLPYWRDNVTYLKGALVNDGGLYYVALESNINTPTSDATKWASSLLNKNLVELTSDILAIDNANIAHSSDFSNPHKVTAELVGTYTKEEVTAKLNSENLNISTHVGLEDNPHQVTYSQLGILPITGGVFKYVNFNYKSLSFTDMALVDLVSGIYLGSKSLDSGLAISEGKPCAAVNSGVLEEICTSTSYLPIRNSFEPLYAVPEPDFFIPLVSGLSVRYGDGMVSVTGDFTFTPSGITILSGVNLSLPSAIGIPFTSTFNLTGEVVLTLGDLVITSTASEISFTEKGSLVYTGAVGKYTLVRSELGLLIYLAGVNVFTSSTPLFTYASTEAFVTGDGGSIKDYTLWYLNMSDTQVKGV